MSAKNKKRIKDLGEFELIAQFQKQLKPKSKSIVGIGDDTAVLPLSNSKHQLITTDLLLEGVHFTKSTEPKDIGRKAINCSISDIAAMGGLPTAAVISLGVPGSLSAEYIKELYRGLKAAAQKFNVEIVGGDTVHSAKKIVNVTLLGEVLKKNLIKRNGARVGDQIFVTGLLGNSLKSKHHLKFTPRIKESQWLVKHVKPTAMIDVSDGLAADLNHICKASECGARLNEKQIPRRNGANLKQALSDGEDFELLFTLSKKSVESLKNKKPKTMKFIPIGEIVKKQEGLSILTKNDQITQITYKGFTHF